MPIPTDVGDLVERVRSGDRRALARAISVAEDRRAGADDLLAASYTGSGGPIVVGITGAPGAGKSSLVSELITRVRALGQTIAVLAIDPSSPFTGGAILGDRIRMQEHVSDAGVFIRSMSTRGHLGGLSDATSRALVVLGAAGFDVIVVETVGVGQSETEIAEAADTTIVVVTPGWGDGIQAAKAGLLEIADLFVINKADLGGAEEVERDLALMLDLGQDTGWRPRIVRSSAVEQRGISEIWDEVGRHREWLVVDHRGVDRRMAQLEILIRRAARAELMSRLERLDLPEGLTGRVASGELDPWSAARSLIS
ncbi:MAG TPA: methylmalonyl Co-A mutase-associated GTPase MeaB [Acidimicrobiia bacterium]